MSNIEYERVNWENGVRTPLNDVNLNKSDKALYEVVQHINKTNTYTVSANNWSSTSNPVYPYQNRIYVPNVYSDDDIPAAQLWGTNEIETTEEITSIGYITKVIVDKTYITIYAKDRPTVDLKLSLKE